MCPDLQPVCVQKGSIDPVGVDTVVSLFVPSGVRKRWFFTHLDGFDRDGNETDLRVWPGGACLRSTTSSLADKVKVGA